MRGVRNLAFLLLFFVTVLCTACAIGTVWPFLDDSAFRQENQPVWMLKVAVFSDGWYKKEEITRVIDEASSSSLLKQAGIGSEGDRKEMLVNKWRDFSKKPFLSPGSKTDLLREDKK